MDPSCAPHVADQLNVLVRLTQLFVELPHLLLQIDDYFGAGVVVDSGLVGDECCLGRISESG